MQYAWPDISFIFNLTPSLHFLNIISFNIFPHPRFVPKRRVPTMINDQRFLRQTHWGKINLYSSTIQERQDKHPEGTLLYTGREFSPHIKNGKL